MTKKDKFSIFLEEKKEKCERDLKEKGVFEEYPRHYDSKLFDAYKDLGRIYRYQNEKQKSSWFFQYLASYDPLKSKYGDLSKEDVSNVELLHDYSRYILNEAIYCDLSDCDPATADKLFGWAAENFIVPQDNHDFWMKHGYYDKIAVAHLWRSYSLLNLGRYEEAHELLVQVVPYLDRYKKSGVEMWRNIEYALTKAVVPLCEYKLNPTEENLANTKKGIEDFIKSLRENRHKLEAYLYYFHLKEKFADVYEAESVPADAKPAVRTIAEEKKIDFPTDDEEPGEIIVATHDVGFVDIFGTNSDMEKYCAQVKELGDFPKLSSLMEIYVTGSELEPEPLYQECERLLAIDGVDAWIRDRTELMMDTAEDAKENGACVYFYFSSDNE